jgi:hypothetical protein
MVPVRFSECFCSGCIPVPSPHGGWSSMPERRRFTQTFEEHVAEKQSGCASRLKLPR